MTLFRCHHCEEHFPTQLDRIEHLLGVTVQQGVKIMTAQDNVNADVTALGAFLADIGTAVTAIKAELDAQGVTVDTTALDALAAQLPAVQASVDALVTTAPVDGDPGAVPVDTGVAPV